ncbi:hypothetical protein JCM3770_002422 [Rhodotorula araucariae]
MPAAQDAFSSICPISIGEYCGAPWQVTTDINTYGTVSGVCIASFFAMLIVLFQPAQSAWYIAAQLTLAHMYLVAVMARNIMGTASNGINGIQRWHAEFAFLLASSITGTIIACVLSDTHYIHGFSSADEHHAFLDADQAHADAVRDHPGQKRYGSHPLHVQFEDTHRTGLGLVNVRRAMTRMRKWSHRHQAVLLLSSFVLSELYWFILYAVTVWWGSERTISWQSNCDTLVGKADYALMEGTSWTFVALSLVATTFLCVPVFYPRSGSAAHLIVRFLSLHGAPRQDAQSRRGTNDLSNSTSDASGLATSRTNTDLSQTSVADTAFDNRAETWIKVVLSLGVWTIWFVLVLIILLRALDRFLLVGTAWPYAAIQNLIFGVFVAIRFLLTVVRERWRRASKAHKARRAARRRPSGEERDDEREPIPFHVAHAADLDPKQIAALLHDKHKVRLEEERRRNGGMLSHKREPEHV